MNKLETIHYEYPLNEHTRICLRLEQLFLQLSHAANGDEPWDSHACLENIIDILNIVDRPDLKAKLAQEFKQHYNQLARLSDNPQIDKSKFNKIQSDLNKLIEALYQTTGKLGQQLRDDQFINNVRQHLLTPGATCSFDIPMYYYWLHQEANNRQRDIKAWMKHLNLLERSVTLLLQLIRGSHEPKPVTAEQGFYQASLEPQHPCQLIRITLPSKLKVIPEVSAGRHRFSVRFYIPDIHARPKACTGEVSFELTTCI